MGGSTSGAGSTSTGVLIAERRRDRIAFSKYFVRAMLYFEVEDKEWEVRRDFEGIEELERVEEDRRTRTR